MDQWRAWFIIWVAGSEFSVCFLTTWRFIVGSCPFLFWKPRLNYSSLLARPCAARPLIVQEIRVFSTSSAPNRHNFSWSSWLCFQAMFLWLRKCDTFRNSLGLERVIQFFYSRWGYVILRISSQDYFTLGNLCWNFFLLGWNVLFDLKGAF